MTFLQKSSIWATVQRQNGFFPLLYVTNRSTFSDETQENFYYFSLFFIFWKICFSPPFATHLSTRQQTFGAIHSTLQGKNVHSD